MATVNTNSLRRNSSIPVSRTFSVLNGLPDTMEYLNAMRKVDEAFQREILLPFKNSAVIEHDKKLTKPRQSGRNDDRNMSEGTHFSHQFLRHEFKCFTFFDTEVSVIDESPATEPIDGADGISLPVIGHKSDQGLELEDLVFPRISMPVIVHNAPGTVPDGRISLACTSFPFSDLSSNVEGSSFSSVGSSSDSGSSTILYTGVPTV
jgi:hypothetical protein